MTTSVVIPAHNEESVIGRALEAVLAQTVAPTEVIVVCNACVDATEEVARRFPVTVCSTEQAGVAHARNLGARRSSGQLLLFVDADVLVPPTLLERVEERARSAQRPVGTVRVRPDRARYAFHYGIAAILIGVVRAASNGLIFCSREVFLGAGGFPVDVRVGEDNMFMQQARRQKGARYFFIRRPAAVSNTRRLQHWGSLKLLFTWIRSMAARDKRSVGYEVVR